MIYLILIPIIILTVIIEIYLIKRRAKPAGQIVITIDERGKKLFSLELDKNPDEIEKMKYIIFEVVDEATEDLD
jgi:hypothetical protein